MASSQARTDLLRPNNLSGDLTDECVNSSEFSLSRVCVCVCVCVFVCVYGVCVMY